MLILEIMHNRNVLISGTPDRRSRNLTFYILPAIIILLPAFLACKMTESSDLPHLAAKFYKVPYAQGLRTDPPPEDSLYQVGMDAFTHKKWDLVISAFSQIPETHPLHIRIMYYTAHALIGKREYDKAFALFSTRELNNGDYVQVTGWYRILTKMFMNKPEEEIVPELKAIADEPHLYYSNNAKEVLKQIEANKKKPVEVK